MPVLRQGGGGAAGGVPVTCGQCSTPEARPPPLIGSMVRRGDWLQGAPRGKCAARARAEAARAAPRRCAWAGRGGTCTPSEKGWFCSAATIACTGGVVAKSVAHFCRTQNAARLSVEWWPALPRGRRVTRRLPRSARAPPRCTGRCSGSAASAPAGQHAQSHTPRSQQTGRVFSELRGWPIYIERERISRSFRGYSRGGLGFRV